MSLDLAAIRAREQAATEGPWRPNETFAAIASGSDSVIHAYYESPCPDCGYFIEDTAVVAASGVDLDFIAHSRSDVPALLAEVRRLRDIVGPCTCGATYATYEGPEEDCPEHGRGHAYWVEAANAIAESRMDWMERTGKAEAEVERLRETVARVEALGDDLASALLLVLHDAHPVYANTTGWRGGIGGQAITTGCSIIDPPPGVDWCQMDSPSRPARAWIEYRGGGLDLITTKQRLVAEWQAALHPEGEAKP